MGPRADVLPAEIAPYGRVDLCESVGVSREEYEHVSVNPIGWSSLFRCGEGELSRVRGQPLSTRVSRLGVHDHQAGLIDIRNIACLGRSYLNRGESTGVFTLRRCQTALNLAPYILGVKSLSMILRRP
jgi:hypothetical protein